MKTNAPLPTLTAPELSVMRALWSAPELGAREIHEQIGGAFDWAYSTTRTTLDRMVKKGLVAKRNSHGLWLYRAAISKARGLSGLVRDFAVRVLESDATPVVSLFADSNALAPEEIAELQAILDAVEESAS